MTAPRVTVTQNPVRVRVETRAPDVYPGVRLPARLSDEALDARYVAVDRLASRRPFQVREEFRGPRVGLAGVVALDQTADRAASLTLAPSGAITFPSGVTTRDMQVLFPAALAKNGRVGATFDHGSALTAAAPCGVALHARRGSNGLSEGLYAVYRMGSSAGASTGVAAIYTLTDGGGSDPAYSNLTGWVAVTGEAADLTAETWSVDIELEVIGSTARCYIGGKLIASATIPDYFQDFRGAPAVWIKPSGRAYTASNIRATEYTWHGLPVGASKIVALGSSITNGSGASDDAHKYRNVLASSLSSVWPWGDIAVVNGGASGSTSTDMLARLPALLAANPDADAVLIETSVNDWKAAAPISSATSRQNLAKMIHLVQAAGMTPVAMSSPPMNPVAYGGGTWTTAASLPLMAQGNADTRMIAQAENVMLVDIVRGMDSDDSATYLADGIHPNDTGHALIADLIAGVLLGTRRW